MLDGLCNKNWTDSGRIFLDCKRKTSLEMVVDDVIFDHQ